MEKNVFERVLEDNENVRWCDGTNKKAYVLKNIDYMGIIFIFVAMISVAIFLVGFIISSPNNSESFSLMPWILRCLCGYFVIIVILIILLNLRAKNAYLCITDKRVIIKRGLTNDKYTYYPLKNIGNITINETLADKMSKGQSADITLKVKDYQNDFDYTETFCALNNAYDANKLLRELTKENNEYIHIKTEK